MFTILGLNHTYVSGGAGSMSITVPTFTFQAGDILVAGVRANKSMGGSGALLASGGGWLVGTDASTSGPGVALIQKNASAGDSGSTVTLSGWVAETTGTPSAALGFVAVVRGIDTNVSGRRVSYSANAGLIVPGRVDAIRPVLCLSFLSYVIPAGTAAPTGSYPAGFVYSTSRASGTNTTVDRIVLLISTHEYNADAVATRPELSYGVSNLAATRNPTTASLALRGASPFKPAIQPYGWYVGANPARVNLGSQRVL